ncbi:X-box-binding protein 1 [Centruroides vittatus]|uniref:X-box-binding protein 1 n=1 Tax=Centruroides vittatus TaxID=120091 RepID=UPI00350ECFCB
MLPKTIVLTTLPSKLPLSRTNIEYSVKSPPDGCRVSILMDSPAKMKDSNSSADEDISPAPIRKRQRLDHLTNEEKMLRRKLKNRVAAQCARDRKKARMSSLEDQVTTLENEKEELMKENILLKEHNEKLEKENLELRRKLEEISQKQSEQVTNVSIKKEDDCCGFIEHASPINGPLQKDQDLQLRTLLMMQFVCLQMIVNLMTFLTCYNSVVKNYCKTQLFLPPLEMKQVKKSIPKRKPMIKWWGPHQQNWNPSKN